MYHTKHHTNGQLWISVASMYSKLLLYFIRSYVSWKYYWEYHDPFQFRWLKGYIYSSCYNHQHIGSIHLSHCYHIFLWLCAWDVCYIIFCHILHTCSGKTGDLFSLLLCSLWWVQIFGYVLACRSYSFICTVHHLIITIVQTYLKALKMPVRYILSSVWVRLSTFSPLSIIQYVGLYVFSLPISLVMISRIYILCLIIIIKLEERTITHCLGLGHETMVSAVCLSMFLCMYQSCFLLKITIWKFRIYINPSPPSAAYMR